MIEKVNDFSVYKVKSEKTGRLRVLDRNLLLPVSIFEEDSMDTIPENSHDFYQIDPEKEPVSDHGVKYEETEITASAEPCCDSSEQETVLGNSSLPESEKTPIDIDLQDDGSMTQPEVRTRSGRVSRPHENYHLNIRCYRKVQMLLSLANNTNHIIVKEVLNDWLNEPTDRTECRDDIHPRGNCVADYLKTDLPSPP